MIATKLGTGKNIIQQSFFTKVKVLTFISIDNDAFPCILILLNHTATMDHLEQNEKRI